MWAPEDLKRILILDRDLAGVEPLRQRLAEAGHAVHAIADAGAAVNILAERPPHLVIVDWNLRGAPALELLDGIRRARAGRPMRLILLSGLDTEQDVVMGLNLGADDYITKPYSLPEAAARVTAVLRSRRPSAQRLPLAYDDLVLDAAGNRVLANGRPISLRSVEYRLLEFLMLHPGQAFNRTQLLSHVWGENSDVDERTVDVNVQRLRKILSEPGFEAYIQTVRGFGYRFAQPT